ncbi:hypothetical protein B7C42_03090 [Nocardia cerradoensis]|uniref:Uncharacterized protein n=1 Tax=Nocardia cerradoensis TaxID=85688 RepID=A0A231H7Z4_9NOCA|nr:hypothetical protein B7C42_03090 [Nocardia cerradoensis]
MASNLEVPRELPRGGWEPVEGSSRAVAIPRPEATEQPARDRGADGDTENQQGAGTTLTTNGIDRRGSGFGTRKRLWARMEIPSWPTGTWS